MYIYTHIIGCMMFVRIHKYMYITYASLFPPIYYLLCLAGTIRHLHECAARTVFQTLNWLTVWFPMGFASVFFE